MAEELKETATTLVALTSLMDLSCQVAAHAVALYGTEEAGRGMHLMKAADQLAEAVGVWAEQTGYTLDEITAPLWNTQSEDPSSAA